MGPMMVVLATGHPLKKHPAELLPEDAVDYEVHRADKNFFYKFYGVAKKKENEILKFTELPGKDKEKSKL